MVGVIHMGNRVMLCDLGVLHSEIISTGEAHAEWN